MADRYNSFEQLREHEQEGLHFRVRMRRGDQALAVMAPHGGKIEWFTSELADEIAGDEYSFYAFEGMKTRGNRDLHITSHRFDEPRALELASAVEVVLALHGQGRRTSEFAMIGGTHRGLLSALECTIGDAGFEVRPPSSSLQGTRPENICNRGRCGMGVQLEISLALRKTLHRDPPRRLQFVDAVRSAMDRWPR